MSIRRTFAVLLITALGTVGVLLAPTAGAAPSTAGRTYVALGDSYAAGFGLPVRDSPPTGQPVAGCEQTSLDYPRRLAATLGLALTDVTCSGAETKDFYAPQNVSGPKPPAQLDIFRTVQPDLVTITIGGNDLGFTSIARTCLASTNKGPIYSHPPVASCKDYFNSSAGASDNPYNGIPVVAAKVRAAIAAVQAAAPRAKIAVIAYPAIAPNAGPNTPPEGCFNALSTSGPAPAGLIPPGATVPLPLLSALPFTDADVPYLQVLQQQLNTAIGQQATALGASYADVYPASLAHSACSPENTRWIEPVLPAGGGTNVLHPSLAGTQAMADTLLPVVQRLLSAAPAATNAPVPAARGNGSGAGFGQVSQVPTGAVATGGGATAGVEHAGEFTLGGLALLAAGGAGVVAARSRRREQL